MDRALWMQVLRVLLVGGSLSYVAIVAGMYLMQDALIFPAMPLTAEQLKREADAAGAVVHRPTTSDGVPLYTWHIPGEGKRVLVWFHGNGGGLLNAGWLAQELPGWDVVAFSYRGYPGSGGHPSEAGLVEDGRTVWRFVHEELGFQPEQTVFMGVSMGGGVANALMTEVRPAKAVFLSTFLSLEQVAAEHYPWLPVRMLLRPKFRSDLRAPQLDLPVLMFHGDRDSIVPVHHSQQLGQIYPNARYYEVPGAGHNDWYLADPEMRKTWLAFLEQ